MDDHILPDDKSQSSQPTPPNIETESSSSISQEDSSSDTIVVDKARVLQLLRCGGIENDHGRVRWSSNYTSLVSLKDEDLEALAIYKPCHGERPLWDFPDGTLYKREVAAFVVSESLDWDLIPPTVVRDGPAGIGSVQLFIEHDPEITYFNLDDSFDPELRLLATFDIITNNADRKGGHCLIDSQSKLWGIDHGICFHTQFKLRTVIWNFAGEPIPDDILSDLGKFCAQLEDHQSATYTQLKELLRQNEIEAIIRRTRQLLRNKFYPQPGSGPNYPWPPI